MARPDAPAATLPRPALDRRLDEAWSRRLTVVLAGPGYGKTTALAAWAVGRPVAWVTCRRRGSSVAWLVQSMLEAVRDVVATLPETTEPSSRLATLDAATVSDAGTFDIVGAMASAVTDLRQPIALVIDDLHFLDRDGLETQVIEHLVLNAPATLRIVLATREAPGFPIERLRGQGDAAVVDARDLSLGDADVAALFATELPGVAASVAGHVHRLTGGWPAAVRLTIDALGATDGKGSALLDRLTRFDGPLFGYLAAEVFDREPEGVRTLLGTIAPFERAAVDLCRQLGFADAGPILADLTARGLLVQPGADESIRIHDLVRAVSLERWQRPPEDARRAASVAARWFEGRGWWLDALRAYERASDTAETCRFLERQGPALVATGSADALIGAAERLGVDHRSRALDQVVGEAHVVRGEPELALRAFDRAARDLEVVPAALAWRMGLLHHLRDELSEAVAIYNRAALDGADPANESILLSWRAAADWRRQEVATARATADRALTLARRSGNDSALAGAHIVQAMIAAVDGRRADVDRHSEAVVAAASRAGDVLQLIRIHTNRGSQLDEEGEHAAAVRELDEAIALARMTGYASFTGVATANRGDAKRHLGLLEEAAVDYREARAIFARIGSRMTNHPTGGLGNVHRERGDLTQARLLYTEGIRLGADSGIDDYVRKARLAQVIVADAPDEARRLIDEALTHDGVFRGRCLVAAGWVHLALGERDRAAALATEAARRAEATRDRRTAAESIELAVMAADDPAAGLVRLGQAYGEWLALGSAVEAARVQLAIGRLGSGAAARATAARAERQLGRLGVAFRPPLAAGLLAALPVTSEPDVAIRTLGGFGVVRGGVLVPTTAWQSRNARQLLKILVARRGRPIARESAAELVWPGEDPKSVANRLSVALTTIRGILDPERRTPSDAYLAADGDALALRVNRVEIDVESFLAAAEAGRELLRRGDREAARDLLEAAERIYVGEFLEEDAYEDWATSVRETARATAIEVARALEGISAAEDDVEASLRYQLRILERDAYDEEAGLGLVRSNEALGRHGEARRAYDQYVARMREIDVEPAPYPDLVGRASP